MNLEVAKKRYIDVFLPDVIDNSQGDFLAKHVPMKTLYHTDHAELTEQDKKHPLTEEKIYELIFSENEDDQFVLVKGASGAGKSHLIRWMNTMLKLRKNDFEIVIPIRRADNTLKGTIRQLISHPVVENMPNKDLYKKMASASTTIPELGLKNTIYYAFINLIESDDGKAGNDEERLISNVDRKHLVALLQNSSFKERLMDIGGPIDRIYTKIAENKTLEVNDKAAQFEDADFEIDSSFRTELINVGADEKARKIADKFLDNPEFVAKVTIYVNKFIEKVVQRCTGLEPGDLREVIEGIRQELYRQGCSLTILIEDITAASGVDDSLLDALLTNKKGYTDKNLCRINSIVGVADGYYRDNFRTNTKGRIKQFVNVPDEMFNGDTDGLIEFFARYLNTVSLETEVINTWVEAKAEKEHYPIHDVTFGEGWGECKIAGRGVNLFPFSKRAIVYLYKQQEITHRNPRAIMRNLIEPYVKDALEDISHYPTKRTTLEGVNPKLQNAIYNRPDLDDETKIRLSQFMYIWGDGTDEIYEENGVNYIAGIPESVYLELGLPIMDGKMVDKPKEEPKVEKIGGETENKPKTAGNESRSVENEQVAISLKEVDKWIENKDYKLSIGATTKNVRALNDARKNINEYLFNVIDWSSEGVPIDAMIKIRDTQGKFLVAFERQTMRSDAVITLSASIESRKIIETFVRWSEVGNKSWNFPGSTDYLYRVQKWTESIKPQILDAILHYDGKEIEYFSYATAAEFYRLILNGYCKNYQNPTNFVPELLLQKNEFIIGENGHTKNWNDLQKMTIGSDGEDNRKIVLQYFNLPQGTAISSTNYEFDYIAFNKAVKKVINTGLKYTEEQLQLDDPVKKRRITSEYLKKILDRIDAVVIEEKRVVMEKLEYIGKFVDLDEVESEEEIKNVITAIKKFYSQAQMSHVSAAVHVNNSLINSCSKNASSILSSIRVAQQVMDIVEPVEALIRFSRDPIGGLSDFVLLIETVNNDLIKTAQEIQNRMSGKTADSDENDEVVYSNEGELIYECKGIIEEVQNKNVN